MKTADLLTEEGKKALEINKWETRENPCYIRVFPEDSIFGEVCEILGVDPIEDNTGSVSVLIVAHALKNYD